MKRNSMTLAARLRGNRGFTLVEMMASLGIGSVVLVLAVSSLTSVSDGYDRNTSGVAAEREARAILTLAAEDLAKAVPGHPPEFERDGGAWPKDRVGFLNLQPDDAQTPEQRLGDLCAVVYYVRDLEIGDGTVRCLLRGFRGSAETLAAVEEGRVESLYEDDEAGLRDEPVAFGVLAFEAEPLVRDESGNFREWNDGGGVFGNPDAVRLRLVVARRELTGKLRNASDWDNSPLLGEFQNVDESANVEVYEVVQNYGYAR